MVIRWDKEFFEKYKDCFDIDLYYIDKSPPTSASTSYVTYWPHSIGDIGTVSYYHITLYPGYKIGDTEIYIPLGPEVGQRFALKDIVMEIPDSVGELFTDIDNLGTFFI